MRFGFGCYFATILNLEIATMLPMQPLKSLVAAAAIALTCLSAPTASAQTPTPVTVRMDVFFYGSHVPILYGIVNGTYKKYGLDVTAQTGRGSGTTLQTVAAGTDQFGFADGGALTRFASQGLKVKMILGILQSTPSIVLALPDSNIKAPKDLEGRTGGFAAGSAPEQLFPALAKAAKFDLDKIKRVGVDIPTRDSLFIQKKIDFSFGYTVTQLPLMEEKCSCKINTINYVDYGLNTVGNGMVVSDEYAAAHPDVVRRFTLATAEAIEASLKEPEKAVDAFFVYAKGTQLSRNVVTRQWMETAKLLHTPETKDKPVGVMGEKDWARSIDLLVEYGGVAKGAVKPEMLFTNQYLAK